MMQPSDQLAAILPAIHAIVDGIDPAQLADPTPCREFTVHDVLDHMIVLGSSFAYWFRGEPAPHILAPPVYGRVPAKEFHQAMDDLLAAERAPGAMDRTITAPVGTMPGDTFARLVAFDGLVHGWDLATATGQAYDLPADVVAEVDAFARIAITDEMRDGTTFAAATSPPADASAIERIVAFSGRTV